MLRHSGGSASSARAGLALRRPSGWRARSPGALRRGLPHTSYARMPKGCVSRTENSEYGCPGILRRLPAPLLIPAPAGHLRAGPFGISCPGTTRTAQAGRWRVLHIETLARKPGLVLPPRRFAPETTPVRQSQPTDPPALWGGSPFLLSTPGFEKRNHPGPRHMPETGMEENEQIWGGEIRRSGDSAPSRR